MKLIDLTGEKYGKLTVLERAKNRKKATMWKCKCECGELTVVSSGNLRNGNTKSCGCLSRRKSSERATKHGAGYEPWYGQWKAMIRRVTNPKDVSYEHYVLTKKLTIDDDFVADPWAFYEEIGEFPGKGYTIDRIDNEKGYIKGNLRWVTQAENNRNKGPYKTRTNIKKGLYKNNKSGVSGITWDSIRDKWVIQIVRNKKRHFGGRFDDLEEAKKVHCEMLKELGG